MNGVTELAAAGAEGAGAAFTYASPELDAMAGAVNYHAAILERFLPYLPATGGHVVEIGAGIGTVAAALLEATRAAGRPLGRLTLVEPAANNGPRLAARFAGDGKDGRAAGPVVDVRAGYFGSMLAGALARSGGVDAVVLVNVLEHVAEDARLLADIRHALKPGGRLCLFVPALPWLYGSLDAAFEHHRRYTVPGLRALLAQAGLRPLVLHYMNAPGVVPWFVAGRVLRRRTLAASAVRLYDRLVTPWVRRLEHHWTPPLGQSVLAVAER
jgi:SAM-dependent methyltransferase